MAHVNRADGVSRQVPCGLDRVTGDAERSHEITPGAGRHDTEHGVGRDRLTALEHAVYHLMDGPVATHRDWIMRVIQNLINVFGSTSRHNDLAATCANLAFLYAQRGDWAGAAWNGGSS